MAESIGTLIEKEFQANKAQLVALAVAVEAKEVSVEAAYTIMRDLIVGQHGAAIALAKAAAATQ